MLLTYDDFKVSWFLNTEDECWMMIDPWWGRLAVNVDASSSPDDKPRCSSSQLAASTPLRSPYSEQEIRLTNRKQSNIPEDSPASRAERLVELDGGVIWFSTCDTVDIEMTMTKTRKDLKLWEIEGGLMRALEIFPGKFYHRMLKFRIFRISTLSGNERIQIFFLCSWNLESRHWGLGFAAMGVFLFAAHEKFRDQSNRGVTATKWINAPMRTVKDG